MESLGSNWISGKRSKLKLESLELLVYNWHNWLLILRRGSDYSRGSYRVVRARSPRKNTKDTKKERKGREQVH